MAESLGSVLLSLGVDLDSFNAGLNQAQQLAAKAGQSISEKLDARRATLSALEKQLSTLEAKLKTNPWSAAALEAPINALKSEIELRKQSIALLEKQVQITRTAANGSRGAAVSEFLAGAGGALPGIGGALNALGPAAGPAATGVAVAAAGAAAVKTANDFQKLNQQLTLLTGSASVTEKVLGELKAYAAATPFDLPGVAENAKLLLAFGLNAEQAVEFTKRLGDVATITGTPLDRLALNLGQIISLGKAYTVDLRQFAIAGVPIFEALSQATGKTVAELKQLDAIPADQVVAAFRIMTNAGGKFFEGGIKGGTQLDTKIASLGDSLKDVGNIIGKQISPVVVGVLKDAITAVDTLKTALALVERLKGKIPGGKSPEELTRLAQAAVSATPAGFAPLLKSGINNLKYELGLFERNLDPKSPAQINKEIQEEAKGRLAAFKKAQEPKLAQERKERQERDAALAKERVIGQEAIAQAQQQYAETLKLSKLKGDVRDVAAEQLRIDAALAAEAKAYVDAYNAQQGKDPVNAQKLQDAATVASYNLNKAMVDGAAVMKAALANAEQRFKAAGEAIKSALAAQDAARVSAFDLISDQAQQETRQRLINQVNEGISSGQLDPNKIRNVVGPDLGTLDIAQLADLAGKSASLLSAQDGIISANKELKEATTNLTGVTQLLAEKDWGVNVSVFADGTSQAYGDVVNRAI